MEKFMSSYRLQKPFIPVSLSYHFISTAYFPIFIQKFLFNEMKLYSKNSHASYSTSFGVSTFLIYYFSQQFLFFILKALLVPFYFFYAINLISILFFYWFFHHIRQTNYFYGPILRVWVRRFYDYGFDVGGNKNKR